MRLLVAAFVLVPVTAAAQPAETREGALREEAVPPPDIVPAKLHTSWFAEATLAETNTVGDDGHAALVTASAAAEVAVSHEACDILVAGGQVSATGDGTPDTAPIAGEQWASLCPLSGEITLVIGHHLAWDVRPTLLAPPRLRPDLNRSETITFDMTGARMQLNDPGPLALWQPPPERLEIIDTEFSFSTAWSRGDDAFLGQTEIGAEVVWFEYEREREDGGVPLTASIVRTDVDFAVGAADAATPMVMGGTVDAVAIDGARVGRARVGGRFGLLIGDVMGADAMGEPAATDVTALDAALSVETDAAGTTWRVAADRGHWALWDGRLVIDDRLSAGASRRFGDRVRARADAFVARDHLVALDGVTDAATTGLTAIVEGDLWRHATARVRAEAGRGFYASGASLETPRWGAEVLATLTMHAGTR